MTDTACQFAVIIPAYNEAKTLRDVATATLAHCPNIIIIDDASTDNTVATVSDLPITVLKNSVNLGKAGSLMRGFQYCLEQNFHAAITIDADNQHSATDIPKFIQAHRNHPNALVIGARLVNTKQAPRHRLAANKVADFFISWAAGIRILDTQSGYRLYPRDLLATCMPHLNSEHKFAFESEIIITAAQQGFTTAAVSIASHYPDDARDSYYHPFNDSWQIGRMVAGKIIKRGMNLAGLWRVLW